MVLALSMIALRQSEKKICQEKGSPVRARRREREVDDLALAPAGIYPAVTR